jgi:hypothetical protein
LGPWLFPWRDSEKPLKINRISLLARCADLGDYTIVMTPLPTTTTPPTPGPNKITLAQDPAYGGLHFGDKDVSGLDDIGMAPTGPRVSWHIQMTRPGGGNVRLDPTTKVMEVEDLILIVGYPWKS